MSSEKRAVYTDFRTNLIVLELTHTCERCDHTGPQKTQLTREAAVALIGQLIFALEDLAVTRAQL